MKAIETTAVFEGPDHLRLAQQVVPAPDFYTAIDSHYRDFPDEPIRTANEWFDELREGESSSQQGRTYDQEKEKF